MGYSNLPMPKLQFFDNSGNPLAGGLLYAYAAGTSTPVSTYTDAIGSSVNPWPVVLDSAGRANIWLGGYAKISLTDSLGNLIWTVDNISLQSGINFVGSWSSSVNYKYNDLVITNNAGYICVASNINQQPPNAIYWTVLIPAPTPAATAAQILAGAPGLYIPPDQLNLAGIVPAHISNLKPVVASAAVLDIFTKSGGAAPNATNVINVDIPDGNGYTPRTRSGSVASGTSIFTLADAANYWSKGSLDAEIKTAWLYAIWSTADSGIVLALGGYSGFTIVPTTTTVTDDDYFLLEGSSTYSRAATDFCIAVCKIRYQYDTADTPDHTIQSTGENAPQVIWNPKSDYGYSKWLATTITSASDLAEAAIVGLQVKQSGNYSISGQIYCAGTGSSVIVRQAFIKTGNATYGSASYNGFSVSNTPSTSAYGQSLPLMPRSIYLNAGDYIHLGGAVTNGTSGNRIIFGETEGGSGVKATGISFRRND